MTDEIEILKAPFPWFGGKSRVAHLVWERFGDPFNYVEPFAGSLAVLLGRPTLARKETINDADCLLSNFWRALKFDPAGVADWADWPINEADLHAVHLWLVNEGLPIAERVRTDPAFYDVRVAGYWVWGLSCWIGAGWCQGGRNSRPDVTMAKGVNRPTAKKPRFGQGRQGVNRPGAQKPYLDEGGRGVNANRVQDRLPKPGPAGVHRKRPDIAGRQGKLKGVHRGSADSEPGACERRRAALGAYLGALADRLRSVDVCCGDWSRVVTPAVTWRIGVTGVFLDPPYSGDAGRDAALYATDDLNVAGEAREWAIANAGNPKLRIALCGYEGEHDMPSEWDCIAWKTQGGYGNRSNGRGGANAVRERIWFSAHCLRAKQGDLF